MIKGFHCVLTKRAGFFIQRSQLFAPKIDIIQERTKLWNIWPWLHDINLPAVPRLRNRMIEIEWAFTCVCLQLALVDLGHTQIFTVKLQLPGSPWQSWLITKPNVNNRFQHSFLQPMKCWVQNNENSTCSLAMKTDQYKFWLFSADVTNFNHMIWMVNISNVNERATPNCVKAGNARVARMSRPANQSAWHISNNFFTHNKFALLFQPEFWQNMYTWCQQRKTFQTALLPAVYFRQNALQVWKQRKHGFLGASITVGLCSVDLWFYRILGSFSMCWLLAVWLSWKKEREEKRELTSNCMKVLNVKAVCLGDLQNLQRIGEFSFLGKI